MSELYEQNVEIWAKKDPKNAARLMISHLEESPNNHRESLDEAKEWLKNQDLTPVETLCLYGIGNGYYYEVLKDWLEKENHFLAILEDDLAEIDRFFKTQLASDLLSHPKVWLYHIHSVEEDKEFLNNFSWTFLRLALGFVPSKKYALTKIEQFEELKSLLLYTCAAKNAYLDEYYNYGIVFYRNFYANLMTLPTAYLGTAFNKKFQGVPAVICGAGPSLKNAFPILKQLEDKALIFAGGSALTSLSNAKIRPHFGVGIDPNTAQYDRLSRIKDFNYPFFYRNRLDHQSLRQAKGPHLYIPGSGGFDTSEWFDQQLEIESVDLDEGYNVVNFATELATAMGCSPIIYVGMDLAFTEDKLYAPGVLDEANEAPSFVDEVKKNLEEAIVLWKDIHGHPIKTYWKWISESDWLSKYSKEHPEVKFINATGEGIGIDGVPNKNLEEVHQVHLQQTHSFDSLIEETIQKNPLSRITEQSIRELMQEFSQSIERAIQNLDQLLSETILAKEKTLVNQSIPENLSALAALAEADLEEEDAYPYLLSIFNEAFTRGLSREFQQIKELTEHQPLQGYLKRNELNQRRFLFLKTVALVNMEIIKMTLEN